MRQPLPHLVLIEYTLNIRSTAIIVCLVFSSLACAEFVGDMHVVLRPLCDFSRGRPRDACSVPTMMRSASDSPTSVVSRYYRS